LIGALRGLDQAVHGYPEPGTFISQFPISSPTAIDPDT
jgi:hypothetical protein